MHTGLNCKPCRKDRKVELCSTWKQRMTPSAVAISRKLWLKKALASLRAEGPNGHAGQARWQVSHRYRSRAESDRCRISDATIHVKSPILMPALEAAVTGEAR